MAETHNRSIKEACAELRLSRTTLYKLHADGHIRFVRIGEVRRTLVPASEIARLVGAMQTPVADPVAGPVKPRIKKLKLLPALTPE